MEKSPLKATNPYHVETTHHTSVTLTTGQKFKALGVACIVGFGSLAIMLALLFGIVVAFAGQETPAPIRFTSFLRSDSGRMFVILALCAVPVAALLGTFSFFRVVRSQRLLAEASLRRAELRAQLATFLDADSRLD